ncbi:MAG: hypothetical protein ABEJ05_10640 [Haloglomus sp.]
MAFESYECTACGESFKAYPDANAADGPYCSPACESDGEGL